MSPAIIPNYKGYLYEDNVSFLSLPFPDLFWRYRKKTLVLNGFFSRKERETGNKFGNDQIVFGPCFQIRENIPISRPGTMKRLFSLNKIDIYWTLI